jgi:hypothetical protein
MQVSYLVGIVVSLRAGHQWDMYAMGPSAPQASVVMHGNDSAWRKARQQTPHDAFFRNVELLEDRTELFVPFIPPRQTEHVVQQIVTKTKRYVANPKLVVKCPLHVHICRLASLCPKFIPGILNALQQQRAAVIVGSFTAMGDRRIVRGSVSKSVIVG